MIEKINMARLNNETAKLNNETAKINLQIMEWEKAKEKKAKEKEEKENSCQIKNWTPSEYDTFMGNCGATVNLDSVKWNDKESELKTFIQAIIKNYCTIINTVKFEHDKYRNLKGIYFEIKNNKK